MMSTSSSCGPRYQIPSWSGKTIWMSLPNSLLADVETDRAPDADVGGVILAAGHDVSFFQSGSRRRALVSCPFQGFGRIAQVRVPPASGPRITARGSNGSGIFVFPSWRWGLIGLGRGIVRRVESRVQGEGPQLAEQSRRRAGAGIAAVFPPGCRVQPVGGLAHQVNEFIMGDQIPGPTGRKIHPEVLAGIFPVNRQAGFELDPQGGLPVEVIGQEVGPVPIEGVSMFRSRVREHQVSIAEGRWLH